MKYYSILTVVLVLTLIISACGTDATPIPPTVNAVDLQNTMVAAAFTMVMETQAAIPTATPPPPTAMFTDTPAATNTIPPLPSLDATFTSAPSGDSTGGDPCINQVMPASLEGDTVKIRIGNSTKATLSVSVYLNQTGPQGECGYRAYTLEPGQLLAINDLVEGCYTLWAWNPVPEDYFIVTNGTNCLDSAGTWVFDITTGSIRLKT